STPYIGLGFGSDEPITTFFGRLASRGGSLPSGSGGRSRRLGTRARRGDRSGSRYGAGGHRKPAQDRRDAERYRRPGGLPRDVRPGAAGVGRPRQGEPPLLQGAVPAVGAPAVAHPGPRLQP